MDTVSTVVAQAYYYEYYDERFKHGVHDGHEHDADFYRANFENPFVDNEGVDSLPFSLLVRDKRLRDGGFCLSYRALRKQLGSRHYPDQKYVYSPRQFAYFALYNNRLYYKPDIDELANFSIFCYVQGIFVAPLLLLLQNIVLPILSIPYRVVTDRARLYRQLALVPRAFVSMFLYPFNIFCALIDYRSAYDDKIYSSYIIKSMDLLGDFDCLLHRYILPPVPQNIEYAKADINFVQKHLHFDRDTVLRVKGIEIDKMELIKLWDRYDYQNLQVRDFTWQDKVFHCTLCRDELAVSLPD